MAKEIADSIGTIIEGRCTKTECETSPWDCEMPHERMKEECLLEMDDDLRREHLEQDQPGPDDCCRGSSMWNHPFISI